MATPAAPAPGFRRIGSFDVVAGAERVARFRAALALGGAGGAGRGEVPVTFPICWLAEPAVKSALLVALGGGGKVPVHLDQEMEYFAPLRIGQPYAMDVGLAGPDARGVARVRADLRDGAGARVASVCGSFVLAGGKEPRP
ncbi:MAG TPA: hypothetical protein PK405_09025 [Hyphomicrobiales bacterium]|nr:hypothetical protein [Rhodobiaceae bacterium]HXK54815.1 hypothetical protein [Hyphomicrobiales bacterium]